jgi:hypothetical protein
MQYMKVPLALRVDQELLARVDAERGDVSRTRWVERALESALSDRPTMERDGYELAALGTPPVAEPRPKHPEPKSRPVEAPPRPKSEPVEGTPLPKFARRHWQ